MNHNIQTNTKIRIYKAAVLTILLDGSEVWNTTKKQHHRLEVFHQRCLRWILRIKWYHRTRNADVLERARINPMETFFGTTRLRWFVGWETKPRFCTDNHVIQRFYPIHLTFFITAPRLCQLSVIYHLQSVGWDCRV